MIVFALLFDLKENQITVYCLSTKNNKSPKRFFLKFFFNQLLVKIRYSFDVFKNTKDIFYISTNKPYKSSTKRKENRNFYYFLY